MRDKAASVILYVEAIPRVFDVYGEALWRLLFIILAASGVVFWLLVAYAIGESR